MPAADWECTHFIFIDDFFLSGLNDQCYLQYMLSHNTRQIYLLTSSSVLYTEVLSGTSCVKFLHSVMLCVMSVAHCLCNSYYLAITVMEHSASSPRDVCSVGAPLQASASSQLWRQPCTYLWHNTNRRISMTGQLWSDLTLCILYTVCIKLIFNGEVMCVPMFHLWN
jgi:hypothetical protein